MERDDGGVKGASIAGQTRGEGIRIDERVTHLFISHGYTHTQAERSLHWPCVFRQVGRGNVNTREGGARPTASWTDKS